jgi:outer membrane protein assembly factor BamB
MRNRKITSFISFKEIRKMQFSKVKPTTAIALFLILSFAISLVAIPAANAHTPPWTIATYAYVNVAPDRIGVGQTALITMWGYFLMPGAALTNDIRMLNYYLNVTKPGGTTTVLGPFTPDPTNTIYTSYTPDTVGNYTIVFWYPSLVYYWDGAYQNDTFLGAVSAPATLTVQEEPLPLLSYPLPTEYWTRPIEGQNTNWWTISSNWLGVGSPQIGTTNFQQDGTAPDSAHIMWTKQLQFGGVVGGSNVGDQGETFYQGGSYNLRYSNPIVMYGRIYYREPFGQSGAAGDTVCVDLRTGAEIWRRSDLPTLSFGWYYDMETPNQHGVFYEGILFSNNFGQAFDARTGDPLFTVTNVPSGTAVLGQSGEILRYVIANAGTSANPDWRLEQWNCSRLWDITGLTAAIPSSANASLASCYDWNVSIPWRTGMTSVTVYNAFLGDVLLGSNGTLPAWSNTVTTYTMWAINLNASKGQIGKVLWMTNYAAPPGNQSIIIYPEVVDSQTRVFFRYYKETMQWYAYNLDTGEPLWGPWTDTMPFDTFGGSVTTENTGSHHVAYGNLYVSGYGGILHCINLTTGQEEWTYGNGGEGNSTFSGLNSVWGYSPIFIAAIADGKIYLFTNEHSPNTPQYKGALVRCVNATTGAEIWTLLGWGEGGSFVSASGAVADGFYTYLNTYDMQIYTVGKGPSSTTVQAPMTSITAGDSVIIQGTVMDVSAGTKQDQQAADFPNGVPAVSDASMSDWMAYVYMQKPKPTNATGVSVSIDAIDPNNNCIHMGDATSDASGNFGFTWVPPDVPGQYTIVATFAGSGSYWSSSAETYAVVTAAPQPTAAPTPMPASNTDTYVTAFGIGIIIAIVVVGAVLVLMLRKRP